MAFDGLEPAIVRGGNASLYALDPAANAVALKNGSTEHFLAEDGQGNTTLIQDSAGTLACSVRFDPFGAPQSAVGADPCDVGSSPHNELFFRGFRRDPNTGTYQFGTRVYDPSKSAFLTPDSYRADDPASGLGVGVDQLTRNTYTYVNGDPVNLVDPDGHSPCKADGYPEFFCKPYKDKKTQRAAVKDYYRRQFDKAIRGQARYGPCPGGAAGPCLLNVYVPGYEGAQPGVITDPAQWCLFGRAVSTQGECGVPPAHGGTSMQARGELCSTT